MNKLAPDGHAPSLSGHVAEAAQGATGEGRTSGKSGSYRPIGPACFQNVTWELASVKHPCLPAECIRQATMRAVGILNEI